MTRRHGSHERRLTTRQRISTIVLGVTGLTVFGVVLVAATNPAPSREPAPELHVTAAPASPSTDLDTPPAIAANGQVDIGGPGIPANVDGLVNPPDPEAVPDLATGLAPWPAEVPLAELTTPMLPGVPVRACASPASELGRAMGNAIVDYLFTWDASKTSFAQWVAPIEREWSRTAGYYGGEGSDSKYGAYTFTDRLEWLELTREAWTAFEASGTRSEVRVNAVTTTMSGRHNLQLIYTVTVTHLSADGLDISTTRDVEVWLTAPCPHDDYGVTAASGKKAWDLTGLQFWDVRGWKTPAS